MSTHTPHVRDLSEDRLDGLLPGSWWHQKDDRIVCNLCPRECSMKEGDRGFCFVRQNVGGEMFLTTYGRSTGFCIDPIEKKPLNHFYPGTSVLSFGTAGCNLGCKFCQNWDISKAREVERLSHRAFPEEIALAAKRLDCHSVAYTYNDPIVWAEYAIDTAKACRAEGVKSVAVTAGYITPEARGPFFEFMDAANVDLKAFTEEFYYKITYSHLEPVLDTLKWLRHETDVWFEITNLIIPDANDNPDEIRRMADWILDAVGDDVPVHFSAFHPDFRMTDRGNTPPETLVMARELARSVGLKHVYVGNVNDAERQSTYCPGCQKLVVERNWYALGTYALNGNQCGYCGTEISGHFEARPGTWGRKRQPVDMRQFHLEGLSAPSERGAGLTTGASMSTAKNQGSDNNASAQQDGIKLDESALNWLASQGSEPEQKTEASQTEAAKPVPVQPVPVQAVPVQAVTAQPERVQQQPAQQQQAEAAPTSMPLKKEQREAIRYAAAAIVKAAVTKESNVTTPDLHQLGVANAAVSGVFVSLKREGRLRSCMGSFGGATQPLLETLKQSAVRTATADPRFPVISPIEIPYLDMEVWLLFAPERVNAIGEARINEVTIGVHGLQIFKGDKRGLLLPGVATDNGWDSEQFLDQVCIKAGLTPTAWKDPDTTLLRFEGNCIKGGLVDGDEDRFQQTRLWYQPEQVEELRRLCRDNVIALVRGATPLYYCGTVPDSTVVGITMTITLPGGQELDMARMSIRDPMPLQTSAFGMCEDVANTLRRRGFLNGNFDLDLSIAYDPTMHGSVAEPSLGGIDPQKRAVLLVERSKTVWIFDQSCTAEELLEEATTLCRITEPVYSQLFSIAFQSTRTRVVNTALPKAVRGAADRPPTVAGRFYPGDANAVNEMLDKLIGEAAGIEQLAVPAAMVPHAGWQFSGRIAADVLKRVKIPKQVILIGPKHTANGVDWAVAPHQVWKLPGGDVASDYELAMKLVEAIDDLEADSAAHQNEHGIEVELPIIHRLAPDAKVVGITIGGGNLQRCELFAEQLAGVIREMDERPLLLISSDMNHYATDAENRRLDAMALKEFDALDADALLNTCRANHISMCGVIPAVIILKTLKKLGIACVSIDVGYATSAELTGDTTRVVGYAGRLLQATT
jgi:AmmeMemoRadiSam system radical SAM enzyme/AmmeMemoRadiSam system protein B/AmmeMemoRadiSam system protein A